MEPRSPALWADALPSELLEKPQRKFSAEELMFLNCGLEKTLESLLDYKEIQLGHPKGDQSWVFIGRTDAEAETPILWPPHGKS